MSDEPVELTPDEEAALHALAVLTRKAETKKEQTLQRWQSRANLAKQVWGALLAVGALVVAATLYVNNLQNQIKQTQNAVVENRKEIGVNRALIDRNSHDIFDLRLAMKDKMDRKAAP